MITLHTSVSREAAGKSRFFVIILFSVIAAIFLMPSCNEDEDKSIPLPPEGEQCLGSGYDVFDIYADVTRLKAAILDVDKLNADGWIEEQTVNKGDFTTTSGTTIEEYKESLSESANLSGSYFYFSGAISYNFFSEHYSYESNSFSTVSYLFQKKQLRLAVDMTYDEMKSYLTETARNNLNDATITPEYIFSTYGTHCLTGVILGGRLDYNVSAQTRHINSQKGIGVYAEASFSYGGVTVGEGMGGVTTEEFDLFKKSQKKRLRVYGGDVEFANDIINQNDYDAWINSIDGKTVFCNFTQHGLVPVWELVDDPYRKAQLEAAYTEWAEAHEISVNPEPILCILDMKVFWADVADPVIIDGREYHRIWADLNAPNLSSMRLYFYYTLGYSNDTLKPLAEVCVVDQTEGHYVEDLPGTGWVKVTPDLNKDAGGHSLFLAYRRYSVPQDKIITGIRVEHLDVGDNYGSLYVTMNNYWYAVMTDYNGLHNQDLNEGSGGYYIYMYYTHDIIYEE